MRVLIADSFPEHAVERLRSIATEVRYEPKLTADQLPSAVGDSSVLIVRSTRVTSACITAGTALSLVIRAGAGVNTIDVRTASERGVYVANCPGKNSIAVAELALGLILALDRRIADNVIDLRAGAWNKAEYSKAEGVYGKRLGVVGVGQIGIELIKRAQACGLQVEAWSRSLSAERASELGVRYCDALEDLVERCDILSIHLALNDDTRGLISADLIDRMRPGTILINTARAEVVDEDALLKAVQDGKLRVGLDVFREEPEGKAGTVETQWSSMADAYITHHIGASTQQAQNAVADETVEIVLEYKRSGRVSNWVNRCLFTEARWQLIVRHYDRPGVLANVMTIIKDGSINAEEIENVIFDGRKTACCIIQLDDKPTEEMLARMREREDEIISVELIDLQI